MDADQILAGLIMELRRGTIVLVVLGRLKEPAYGYSLMQALSRSGIPIEANTLYPLLRRLEDQGLLTSNWEVGETKPRKYYKTTELGNEIYTRLKKIWLDTVAGMSNMWGEQIDE